MYEIIYSALCIFIKKLKLFAEGGFCIKN